MRRWLEERRETGSHEGSHFGMSDRRLRPSVSEVSAVNWPEVGSETPEDPLSEDVVSSGGGVSLGGDEVLVSAGGGRLVEVLVSVLVSVLVESSVVSSVVSVSVESSGGVKSLVSVILDGGDKSVVSVEFDTVVELVGSVQLKSEVMLERSVLFIRAEIWLAGIRQVVVVVVLTPDVRFERDVASVRLVLFAPAVTFEIIEGSVMVVLETTVEPDIFPIHAGGGVGKSLKIALVH